MGVLPQKNPMVFLGSLSTFIRIIWVKDRTKIDIKASESMRHRAPSVKMSRSVISGKHTIRN